MGPGTLQELLPSLDLSHNHWVTVSTTTSKNNKRQNNEKEGKHERSSGRIEFCLFFLFWPIGANCMCVYTFDLAVLSVFVPLYRHQRTYASLQHANMAPFSGWPITSCNKQLESGGRFQTPGRWIIAHFVHLEHNVHVTYRADKMRPSSPSAFVTG